MTAFFGAGIRLLAVDLDGTLVDSALDLNHCLGVALESVGLPRPTEAQTRSWIGDGVEELIRRGLAQSASALRTTAASASPATAAHEEALRAASSEETFRTARASFSSCYTQNLFARSRLYPRVPETLDALLERGMRLCCVTNKRIGFANGVLEQAGIADRFELVLGGDSLPQKKPSPVQLEAAAGRLGIAPSAAALVGDSHHDFHAAKNAGWPFVWATYGYCATIDAAPEDRVARIAEFADLLALFPGS